MIDEAQLSSEFSVCDNVDLETIYLEFSSYFQIKFGKKPRFVKKVDPNILKTASISTLASLESRLAKKRANLKTAPHVASVFPEISAKDVLSSHCLRVSSLSPPTQDESSDKMSPIYCKPMSNEEFFNCHPLDWKEMTEIIFKDVVRKDLCVKWDDIMGQDDAKMIIQESAIFPMKYPQLFSRVQPWKGLWDRNHNDLKIDNNLVSLSLPQLCCFMAFPGAVRQRWREHCAPRLTKLLHFSTSPQAL